MLGVIIFAGASALCGATPTGGAAEAWLVAFGAVQGAGGAIMFPAAIAIVVVTFDLRSRGRALALFFGIARGLTAIGPIAGGYLIEWTWRAIFWINIPVALIALALIAISKPANECRPAPMVPRGLALIIGGVGLSMFGFQQSALWGWGNPAIEVCIAAGVLLLIVFFTVERRTESPLINVRIFRNQAFLVENIILGIAMMAFIPVFFFAAIYGQIALAEKATTASLLILYFFLGFVVCAQIGGRMLDRIGAKRPVVLGSVLAATGFGLWASHATDLHVGAQVIYIVMAGAGMGLMLGQANTDAINRASRYSYGEATGITQTVRNYGASLGFAILGTLLITRFRSAITPRSPPRACPARGVCAGGQDRTAAGRQRQRHRHPRVHPRRLRGPTRDVLYGMAIIMAVAAFVALRGLRRGVQEDTAPPPRNSAASFPATTQASASTRPGGHGPEGFRDESLQHRRGPGHRGPGGRVDHAACASHGLQPSPQRGRRLWRRPVPRLVLAASRQAAWAAWPWGSPWPSCTRLPRPR